MTSCITHQLFFFITQVIDIQKSHRGGSGKTRGNENSITIQIKWFSYSSSRILVMKCRADVLVHFRVSEDGNEHCSLDAAFPNSLFLCIIYFTCSFYLTSHSGYPQTAVQTNLNAVQLYRCGMLLFLCLTGAVPLAAALSIPGWKQTFSLHCYTKQTATLMAGNRFAWGPPLYLMQILESFV